jgi:hypothetical protein
MSSIPIGQMPNCHRVHRIFATTYMSFVMQSIISIIACWPVHRKWDAQHSVVLSLTEAGFFMCVCDLFIVDYRAHKCHVVGEEISKEQCPFGWIVFNKNQKCRPVLQNISMISGRHSNDKIGVIIVKIL